MTSCKLQSWGRYPHRPQQALAVSWPEDVPRAIQDLISRNGGLSSTLAFGNGRSYGDSCLAESDHVLWMRRMDRILTADWERGIIRAQAGMTLAELIQIALPRGWFLPVTPGTKFVTLGGAVANDVHGKNHHVMGTIGCHIERLGIYRSDEGEVECSATHRPNLFAATIGGLGLTGVMLWVELRLRRITSSDMEQRSFQFGCLNEFFDLSEQYDSLHEYTVAWVDCAARGAHLGRGRYFVANHAADGPLVLAPVRRRGMPFDPPVSLINKWSLRSFNAIYYCQHSQKSGTSMRVNYDPYFYPLDALLEWNRIYGRKGFQQYQCVIPEAVAREAVKKILDAIAHSGAGSFLSVLKRCGAVKSPGVLSFPAPGITLALDFPQHERTNQHLFQRLDALIHDAGGRLYPAKDAHMSAIHFQHAYPRWKEVEALRDPILMSQFWKRVTA